MQPHSVLIMDGDPALLSIMMEILESAGYRVLTATLGAEALQIMDEQQPFVVFFGSRVPADVGATFVSWLKQREPAPRVVGMAPTREALRWAEQIGADDFLAKPFDAGELLATVRLPDDAPDPLC